MSAPDHEVVTLFRDWVDLTMSALAEGIHSESTGAGMVADWRYFIAAEAKPRAERLGIPWRDTFVNDGRRALMDES